MATRFDLTGSISDFADNESSAVVIVTPSVDYVKDTSGNVLIRGGVVVPVADGFFTISLPATNDETLDPHGFTYSALIRFADGETIDTVDFSLEGNTNILQVTPAAEQLVYVPPSGGGGPHDHPEYLTQAEGEALFSPLAHNHNGVYSPVGHTHDEYLTQAEADALYLAIGSGGSAGEPGSKWLSGAGAPAGGTGVVSDWYLNTTNYDIYEKTAVSTWTSRGNLKGATGNAGPANTLTIGTVTTGAAGSSAAATVTGTAPNQTLNLTIPRGDTGTAGTNGQGVPTGGTAGQKLEKVDGTNYNTAWVDSARVIVINNGAAVPGGTPAGTVIIEKNA